VPRVLTSRYLQTNATVLPLPGGGVLVVDSPYFPDELDELAAAAGGARPTLFATHSHYDHLMGRLAFPGAPLHAAEDTVAALDREPRRPARELAQEDARTYVRRDRPLDLTGVRAGAPPGIELVPATGHTGDGAALLHHDAGTLCCGDYLSDVELPLLSWAGSLPAYAQTLDRLERALEGQARLVVPGHGSPTTRDEARRRLDEDRAYLATIAVGDPDQPLPPGRDSDRQREIHRANLERHG
jgi:glyoxylase-like metal-dependent hydrolase (beta-lactamase superfamily II)